MVLRRSAVAHTHMHLYSCVPCFMVRHRVAARFLCSGAARDGMLHMTSQQVLAVCDSTFIKGAISMHLREPCLKLL
jgi:hypothetical protein